MDDTSIPVGLMTVIDYGEEADEEDLCIVKSAFYISYIVYTRGQYPDTNSGNRGGMKII